VPRPDQPLLASGAVDYEALAAAEINADVFGDVLASAWAAEYRLLVPAAELVEVDLGTLTYLFDLTAERTLGVYGRSAPTGAPRPTARLRGHPSYNRPGHAATDRGHLAAHAIGGGADINLVAQDHLLNVSGAWRSFERYAERHRGTAFAVQARYLADDARPHAFVYSMIRDGRFVYREFRNAPPRGQHSAG
jgi:DNA/RNA non-specific endonuclease